MGGGETLPDSIPQAQGSPMSTELRARNQSQQLYVQALSSAYRNGIQLHDPSIWQLRDPEVEEKMLRDADIAHAVSYRQKLIAGKGYSLVPQDESSPRAKLAVMVGTQLLGKLKKFSDARLNLARAFFSGARFGRIKGRPEVLTLGDGKPRTWWVPTSIEDQDKRVYRIVPHHDDEDNITATWERWHTGRRAWEPETAQDGWQTIRHVYEDSQSKIGHGSALREALGWHWYAKEHVFSESLQAVERFAQGILHAKVDGVRDADTGLPNEELIEKWTRVMEDLRGRHVLVSDKHDEVEIISGNGEGHQLLESMRAELRSAIHTLILGANLTTSADSGGSYALAEVQENSTAALVEFDRNALEETLTDDLLGCIWLKNWVNLVELGIARERPEFSIDQEKVQDPEVRARVAQTLNTIGVGLSLVDVLEQTGFRQPEEGEDVVAPAAASRGLLGGFGGLAGAAQPASAMDPTDELQDLAMNGAQVNAAADIIDRVVHNTMPPRTAVIMLVSMFGLDPTQAQAMVDDAAGFTPEPAPVAAEPVPGVAPAEVVA